MKEFHKFMKIGILQEGVPPCKRGGRFEIGIYYSRIAPPRGTSVSQPALEGKNTVIAEVSSSALR